MSHKAIALIFSILVLCFAVAFYAFGLNDSSRSESEGINQDDGLPSGIELKEKLYTLGQATGGFSLRLTNCEWSPGWLERHHSVDQNNDCQDYFGPGYVMVNYDCQKDGDYCRFNRIKCCRITL